MDNTTDYNAVSNGGRSFKPASAIANDEARKAAAAGAATPGGSPAASAGSPAQSFKPATAPTSASGGSSVAPAGSPAARTPAEIAAANAAAAAISTGFRPAASYDPSHVAPVVNPTTSHVGPQMSAQVEQQKQQQTHPVQSFKPTAAPTSASGGSLAPGGSPSPKQSFKPGSTSASGGSPAAPGGSPVAPGASPSALGGSPAGGSPVGDLTAGANVSTEEPKDTFFYRMLEKTKEFAFRYTQKKNPPQQVIFPSYAEIKKVLILFESDFLERNSQLKQLVKEIQADGKVVTAWGFVNKKVTTSAILRDYRVLGQKDFNFLGKPKDYELQDLANEHFDLLISLNVNNLMQLRYLGLYANADFRAGLMTAEPYESNFMVKIPEDERDMVYLFDQIMKYIRRINAAPGTVFPPDPKRRPELYR